MAAWSAEASNAQRFVEARAAFRRRWPRSPAPGKTFTGFMAALARLGMPLVKSVANHARRWTLALGAEVRFCGYLIFALDGARVEAPRTAANQKQWRCAGKRRTGPQLMVTVCWHLATGLPLGCKLGPGVASERRAAESLAALLPAMSLLVADAGFAGYEFIRRLLVRAVSFLLRVGGNLRLLKELGACEREGPDTVHLWPDHKRAKPPLVLRLIAVAKGRRKMYLITNIRDHARLSDLDTAALYRWRWGIEAFFRGLKQTLARRRARSGNPTRAEFEMHWLMLGYWLLGLQAAAALAAKGRKPCDWSAALARNAVRTAVFRGQTAFQRHRRRGHAERERRLRTSSKQARDWPHKKTDPPCGPPACRIAADVQRAAAAKVCAITLAA